MQPHMYTTSMARVVWAKLIPFVLQPQIHKNYNNAHIQGIHKVMFKYTFEEQNWYALESNKPQVKTEFTETGPLAAWCPVIWSLQTGIDATLLN